MVQIIFKDDSESEMGCLIVNWKTIAFGSHSDFNFPDMISAITKTLTILGIDYKYSSDTTWRYPEL